jgi:uncharacterized OB-fold protein
MGKLATQIPGDQITIEVDRWTEPFWNAAKEGRLVAPQCAHGHGFRMPPTPFCPTCNSQDVTWAELPGTGEIYSFVICHRSPYPGVPDFTFAPVVVELDGAPGVRLISTLVDVDTDTIAIGAKVRVDFQSINGGWKSPVFHLAKP